MTVTDIRDITAFKWATVMGTNPLSIKLDGDTAPLALIPDSLVDPLSLAPGDRVRTELSLRKVVVHGVSKGGPAGGSTSARNTRYGSPSTDAQRVALANRKVRWFNTDLGWEESYYAVTGLAGLAVPGLVAGTASGWYPTGLGPEISMFPTAGFAATTGNYVGAWNGDVRRKGGASWFLHDQYGPTILQPGYYDLALYTVQGSGTGLADYHVRLNNIAGTVVEWQSNLSGIALSTSYITPIGAEFRSQPSKGNQLFRMFCSNGTLNLHQTTGPAGSGRGQLHVRYVRPLLVSD